jgi:hypothetical protein
MKLVLMENLSGFLKVPMYPPLSLYHVFLVYHVLRVYNVFFVGLVSLGQWRLI